MTGIDYFLSRTIWVLRRSGIGPIQFLKAYILISTFKDLCKMLKISLITSECSNEHSFVNQDLDEDVHTYVSIDKHVSLS